MPAPAFESGRPIRILHVEDDPAHAELIRRGFEGHRLRSEITHCLTGEDAMQLLDRWHGEGHLPDVVLLDLRLPGADGLEILERLRARPAFAELPVVVLTTSEAEWDRVRAYRQHINGYIVKPFDFDSFAILLDVISRLIPADRTLA